MEPQLPSMQVNDRLRISQTETPLTTRILGSLIAHRNAVIATVAITIALAVLNHIFLPRYSAKSVLLVQRAENSPIQAMMGKMIGNPSYGGKQNEYLEKYIQYLNSHEFFLTAARSLAKQSSYHVNSAPPSKLRAVFSHVRGVLESLLFVKITDPSQVANETEALAHTLSSNVLFSKTSQDNIVVQVRAADYREAVDRANFLAATAVKAITESELKELNDAKEYIESQQASTENRLTELDSAIVEYRRTNKLVKADAAGKDVLERVGDLRKNLEANQLKFNQNQRLIALLSRELSSDESQILAGGSRSLQSSEVLNQFREQIQTLRYQKMLLQAQGLKDDSNQIKGLDSQIDQVAARIKERIFHQGGGEKEIASVMAGDKEGVNRKIALLNRENEYLSSSIDTLGKALNDALISLEALPEAQQKMLGFQRGTQLEFALLQEMKKKTLEIDLERVALDSKIRILERATIAGIPARLNLIPTAFLAALLGFALATGGAYLKEELNDSVKNRHEISELGMIPVGSVPKIAASPLKKFMHKGRQTVDVSASWADGDENPEVMAFKHVRATVLKMRSSSGKPAQTICVLGATPGDGKSFISANIAFALAQMGKKTLLLDGDLRRPSIGSWLGISSKVGLTSILTNKKKLSECLTQSVQLNLDVLPSGPASKRATEIFSEAPFAELLDSLKTQYDYIVIDTPPVLSVVDGLVLSAASDAMIFAVSHRKTKIPDIEQAMEKIRYFDDRPVFAIYNRAEGPGQYNYYNYMGVSSAKKGPTLPLGPDLNLKEELGNFKKWWSRKQAVTRDGYA